MTLALAFAFALAAPSALFAQAPPITYVRCPRADAPVEFSADVRIAGETRRVSRTFHGMDAYDALPDVTRFLSGFTAPCDLMLRHPDGREDVLYDCTGTSTDEAACAAMDPAVSHDGRTIAFAVFRGSLSTFRERLNMQVFDPTAERALAENVSPEDFPNRRLSVTEAQLHLVDVETGVVTPLPFAEGEIDAGPAFLPNGRLAFTSTRGGHRSTLVWRTNQSSRGTAIWTMDIDGRNIDHASHHSLAQEQHPYVLRDGRVAYASWQIFGGLPFRYTNGSPGGFDTLANIFHIYTQSPDGGHNFAFYGQHSGNHRPSHFGASHNAAHFLAQTSDERVWTADYYRRNNQGLGLVVGILPEPEGQEGLGPHEIENDADIFAPRDAINFAPWATNGDAVSAPMPSPEVRHPDYADPLPFVGKVGHPAALPGNGLMVAWGKGPCSTVTGNRIFRELGLEAPPLTAGSGQGTSINLITSLDRDTPHCDLGIYRATAIPSAHPGDLEVIVDSRQWHEFMARAVVSYETLMGVAAPAVIERSDRATSHSELEVGTPFGLLGAASITDRETHPHDGLHFAGEHQFHSQGTDTIDYEDEDLCGVRILGVMPNRSRQVHQELRNYAGERVAILGEVSVRNRDAEGNAIVDPSGHADTSFLLRMPANMPYLMQGIDCEGRTLNTDQTWQSLRPGEEKTCGGCHVHSGESRIGFGESFAALPEYDIAHLGEGWVPMLAGENEGEVAVHTREGQGLRIDFARDIEPIFERRCNSCHGGDNPDAGLALDRPGIDGPSDDEPASTWWCLIADSSQRCVPEDRQFDTGVGRDNRNFRRPQLTRYVRAFNSISSLLYWKARGQRTDGRSDGTFTDASPREDIDIDFGAAHPTEITPEELGLLSRWIDIGAPAGPGDLDDTLPPTLHLAALTEGGAVTALRIGTTDLGAGVAPGTLRVCIDPEENCNDFDASAEPTGILTLELDAPLANPDTEVYVYVEDEAGNAAETTRTVAWLLGSPAPPPPRPDAGPRRDAGAANDAAVNNDAGSGEVAGGCSCRSTQEAPPLGLFVLFAIALLRRRKR